ncbi:PPE family protein [Mycobacterium tuberculosis]|nr:PPE family protein [Mycobacterium tuberculosis]
MEPGARRVSRGGLGSCQCRHAELGRAERRLGDLRVVQHQHPGSGHPGGGLGHRQPRPAAVGVLGKWDRAQPEPHCQYRVGRCGRVQHRVGQCGGPQLGCGQHRRAEPGPGQSRQRERRVRQLGSGGGPGRPGQRGVEQCRQQQLGAGQPGCGQHRVGQHRHGQHRDRAGRRLPDRHRRPQLG